MSKMLILKFLLVVTCYSVYGSESSEEFDLLTNPAIAPFVKKAINKVYNEQKLTTISTVEEKLQEIFNNITLVGSQNIYGNNGEILEIRTVELHLPRIPAKGDSEISSLFNESEEDEDEDEDFSMSQVRQLFNQISVLGFELIAETEEFDRDGEVTTQTHLEDDLYYQYFDDQLVVNKTIEVESLDFVEKAVADLKKKHTRVSVHKFNDKLQFVPEGSDIVPEYVALITAVEGEVHQEVIDEILKGASSLFIETNEELDEVVTGQLVKYLKSRFNGTDFYVVSGEPDGWYLRKDNFFRVAVEYDLNIWDSRDELMFTVFGVKAK